jgi:hypothetical protein
MGFDEQEIEAAVALLLEQADEPVEDAHELLERLRQVLDQMRAMGMTPPEDLLLLESGLDAELTGPPQPD